MKLGIQYLENYNKFWEDVKSADGDSGYDLRAAIKEPIVIAPGERRVVPNGIKTELKLSEIEKTSMDALGQSVEIQVRPRSGLAAKKGITIVNTPGTVDFSYRGEVMTILLNTGNEPFEINPGDRIAQMVVCPVFKPAVVRLEDTTDTSRGEGGFGHTGV